MQDTEGVDLLNSVYGNGSNLTEEWSTKAIHQQLKDDLADWNPPAEPGDVDVDNDVLHDWAEFESFASQSNEKLSHLERVQVYREAKFILDAPADISPPIPKRLLKQAYELGIGKDGLKEVAPYKARAFLQTTKEFVERIREAKRRFGMQEDLSDFTTAERDRLIKGKSATYYIDMAARADASRRLAAEDYSGARRVEWDDLAIKVEWLVDTMLTKAGTAFLVGKRNRGKTFVAIDLACNLILGRAWLGMSTGDGVKVMYVLGEGVAGFRSRVEAWCDFNGVPITDIRKGLVVVESVNLSSDVCLDQLAEVANAEEVDLIIFDTYIANAGVESENDAALNQRVVNDARAIRPEAAVLFLHHPTKETADSDRPVMRGSGALDGTVDTVMTIWKDTDYMAKPGVLGPRFAISTDPDHGGKSREAEPLTLHGFSISSHHGSAVLVRDDNAEEGLLSPGAKRVAEHLTDGMTVAQYEAATGVSHGAATKELRAYAAKIPNTKPVQWKKAN